MKSRRAFKHPWWGGNQPVGAPGNFVTTDTLSRTVFGTVVTHSPSLFFPRGVAVFLLLGGVFTIVACASETSTNDGPDAPSYSLGSPLADSSLALVVESPYGRDTVQSDTYREKLASLRREQEGTHPDTSFHRSIVRGYTLRHVMVGEAREREVEIDSGRLARRMRAHQQGYENRSAFRRALAKQGTSVDSVRQREANTLRVKQLRSVLAKDTDPPTEAEVQTFRRKQRREEVRLRYILFSADSNASGTSSESTMGQAEAVLDSIEAGASFPVMARRHSDAPTSKVGGIMPRYRPVDQFEKPMTNAIETLRDSGKVADAPVPTSHGIYLVQLVDRRTSPLMPKGKARWKLLNKRRRETIRRGVRSLLKRAEVRVNPQLVELGYSQTERR